MQTQGEQLLKDLEALKIKKKESYRGQVEAFVTQDIDPMAWNKALQKQKDTKAQTDTIRELRSEVVNTLQHKPEALTEVGIKATT